MGKLTFGPEDIAVGQPLKPGWYPAVVERVTDGTTKAGDEMIKVVLNLLEAETHTDDKVANVKLTTQFMPKYPAFARTFLTALGADVSGKVKADKSATFELNADTAEGKRLEVYVKNDQYEGRTTNKATDYRPAQ